MSTTYREQWIVQNISSRHISLGTGRLPALKPNDSYDLLLYMDMEHLGQSKAIKSALDRGWITITKRRDGVDLESVNSTNSDAALVTAQEEEAITLSDGLDLAGSIHMNGNSLYMGDGVTDLSGGLLDVQGGTINLNGGDIENVNGIALGDSNAPANNSHYKLYFNGTQLKIIIKTSGGLTKTFTLIAD